MKYLLLIVLLFATSCSPLLLDVRATVISGDNLPVSKTDSLKISKEK
jgi:hypothetical protein